MNKKKYNKITLFLIPISILIVNIIFSIAFIGYVKINSITLDKKHINENTITSTLYNIIEKTEKYLSLWYTVGYG